MWDIVAATATAAAAIFAGYQILQSRRNANSRAVFEHFREVDARLQRAWRFPTDPAREEILEYYRGDREDLTDAAEAYLSLLNSLDLLAFAVKKKLVEREDVAEYHRTLRSPSIANLSFITEFRACCKDDRIFEHFVDQFLTERQESYKFFG